MALAHLSVVRLRADVAQDHDVDADAVGVVVDVYKDGAYEVEFSNERDGTTIALLTLTEDQIEPIVLQSPAGKRKLAD